MGAAPGSTPRRAAPRMALPLCPLCWQKADKSALAAKVSRVQFDATTEQLNHMMQELVAKMSGQEQDWQKILDRLLTEMDNKVRAKKRLRASRDQNSAPSPGTADPPTPPRPTPLEHTGFPHPPPAAGPPGAGPREARAGGPVEVLATAAQRAPPTLPGGRGGGHAEVGPGGPRGRGGGSPARSRSRSEGGGRAGGP